MSGLETCRPKVVNRNLYKPVKQLLAGSYNSLVDGMPGIGYMTGPGVIIDGACLSPEVVPAKLVGREKEFDQLAAALAPMTAGHSPLNAWLHGPPGSGKTAAARWALETACAQGTPRLGVYVNCWQRRTLYSVLQATIDELRTLGSEAQDTHVKLDRIRQAFRGRPAVIVLDEIDRPMPGQREEILYGLLSLPKTGIICIANSTHALATLDERVHSRLSPVIIHFPAHSRQELVEILTERARHGLLPGCWSPRAIARIADAAGGDARMAIQALRQAATAAEEAGQSRLDVRLVEPFLRQWQAIRREAQLASLSEHERILRQLAARHGPIGTTDLRQRYARYCQGQGLQPVARRTLTKYLGRLSSAGVLTVSDRPLGTGGRVVRAA